MVGLCCSKLEFEVRDRVVMVHQEFRKFFIERDWRRGVVDTGVHCNVPALQGDD